MAEPDEKIKQNVFKCLDILLKITAVYKGAFSESYINKSDFIDKIMLDNNPESCKKIVEVLFKMFCIGFIFCIRLFFLGHFKNISAS